MTRLPIPEAAQPLYPSLKISGFSDFNFSATDLHGPSGGFSNQTLLGAHSGFQEGQFDLHLSSALSQKVTVFGELSLTARSDAGLGTPAATGFNAEVERLIIRYDLNDYFKVSFGRYHTPINYWNTTFHHGQWLQTTASRPEMTQFGGSFIPVHFVGMLVEGAVPAGGLNLNYNLGLGNGRGQVISRGGDLGDINNNRAWLVNAFIKPDIAYGLQVGGSVYRDEINPTAGLPTREWIQSAHIVWQKETPEVIAEFANVTHQAVGARRLLIASRFTCRPRTGCRGPRCGSPTIAWSTCTFQNRIRSSRTSRASSARRSECATTSRLSRRSNWNTGSTIAAICRISTGLSCRPVLLSRIGALTLDDGSLAGRLSAARSQNRCHLPRCETCSLRSTRYRARLPCR